MNGIHELLIGCGHDRVKRIRTSDYGGSDNWQGLVTLDNNPAVKPDILCDLDTVYGWVPSNNWGLGYDPPPCIESHGALDRIRSDYFNEVHAYEVLEHLGQQGDAVAFFAHFSEIWRILKPGGYLCATVPNRTSVWLWGDPSHRRVIYPESLVFLDQTMYARNLDGPVKLATSDFRHIYKCDFRIMHQASSQHQFWFVLQAVKPARTGPTP